MRNVVNRLDPRRAPLVALLVAPAVVLFLAVALTPEPTLKIFGADLGVYRDYGARLLAGWVPYLDYDVEYPPLALLPMTIPVVPAPPAGALPPPGPPIALEDLGYAWRFVVLQGLLAVLGGWLLYRAADRSRTVLVAWIVLVGLSWASVALRYDLWPVLCVLVAVLAMERRPGVAGVALGLGTMLKLYPIGLLPVLAAYALARGDRAGLGRLIVGCVVVVGLVAVVAWALAGPASLEWLRYHQDRGLQVESLGAGLLLALHLFAGLALQVTYGFGSVQVQAPGADVMVAASTPLTALLVVGAVILAVRRFRSDVARLGDVPRSSLVLAAVATILAILLGSKVLSVQYVIWILPFVPLLPGRMRWLALAVVGLSTAIYTTDYTAVWTLQPPAILALVARNVLLVGLAAWVVLELARGPGQPAEDEVAQPPGVAETAAGGVR